MSTKNVANWRMNWSTKSGGIAFRTSFRTHSLNLEIFLPAETFAGEWGAGPQISAIRSADPESRSRDFADRTGL
jgi:hypothetical protein